MTRIRIEPGLRRPRVTPCRFELDRSPALDGARPATPPGRDPVWPRVDVEAVAAQEAHQGHAQPLRGLHGEVARGGDGGEQRDARDGRLLDELEAGPARDQQHPVVERQLAGQQPAPDELVQGVVPADVLAQRDERPVGGEQPRRVEAAGGTEDGLTVAEARRQREQRRRGHDRAVRDGRAADLHLVQRGLAADAAGRRGHEVAARDACRVQGPGQADHDVVVGAGVGPRIRDVDGDDVPAAVDQALRQQEPGRELRLVTRGAHGDRDVDGVLPGAAGADRHGLLAGQPVVAGLGHAGAPRRHADMRGLALDGRTLRGLRGRRGRRVLGHAVDSRSR